jgi:hypothetical protein
MSSFTVGLAILGGLILAIVVGWNAWTARATRSAPRQPTLEERKEPATRPPPVEPSFDDADDTPLPMPERKPGLDALIDVLAPIAVDAPVSGDAALAALPPRAAPAASRSPSRAERGHAGLGDAAGRPALRRVPGRRADGQPHRRAQRDRVLRVRGQGAGLRRRGERRARVPRDAARGGARPRARPVRRRHDAQLGFTLRARNAAWSPGYVHQNAARLGFVAGVIPGRMVLPCATPGQPPILVLSFDTQAALSEDPAQSAIREVTLSLDVPQVHRAEQPFVRMREAAIALAASMDGAITDDNGQVIRPEALDVIGADLEGLYDTLESRDLAAGSPQARRLFS